LRDRRPYGGLYSTGRERQRPPHPGVLLASLDRQNPDEGRNGASGGKRRTSADRGHVKYVHLSTTHRLIQAVKKRMPVRTLRKHLRFVSPVGTGSPFAGCLSLSESKRTEVDQS
jgi:hypothetical protein